MKALTSNIRFMRSVKLESKRKMDALAHTILKQLEKRYHCKLTIDQKVVSQIDSQDWLTVLAMPAQDI